MALKDRLADGRAFAIGLACLFFLNVLLAGLCGSNEPTTTQIPARPAPPAPSPSPDLPVPSPSPKKAEKEEFEEESYPSGGILCWGYSETPPLEPFLETLTLYCLSPNLRP